MFFASAGATTKAPSRRRVRLLGLCSSRWFLLARRRITLPEPVSLNRFLAPLCVLVFGMVAVVSLKSGPPGCTGARLIGAPHGSRGGRAWIRLQCTCVAILPERRTAGGAAGRPS